MRLKNMKISDPVTIPAKGTRPVTLRPAEAAEIREALKRDERKDPMQAFGEAVIGFVLACEQAGITLPIEWTDENGVRAFKYRVHGHVQVVQLKPTPLFLKTPPVLRVAKAAQDGFAALMELPDSLMLREAQREQDAFSAKAGRAAAAKAKARPKDKPTLNEILRHVVATAVRTPEELRDAVTRESLGDDAPFAIEATGVADGRFYAYRVDQRGELKRIGNGWAWSTVVHRARELGLLAAHAAKAPPRRVAKV